MDQDSPYHEGELEVQARAGVTQSARRIARIQQDHLPTATLPFIRQQAMAVLGSLDARGHVWASVLFGSPGFLHVVDATTLHLQRRLCHHAHGDPVWENLGVYSRLGILLIELATRRRLRINGNIRPGDGGDYHITVERAYANCPRYIQRRHLTQGPAPGAVARPFREGTQLDVAQQTWIRQADTVFVASAHPDQGVDASHRGGHPGFIEVLNPRRLRIPDYAGNNMFNTLGNFVRYPHAGLLFMDFDDARILQLIGRPELYWDTPHACGPDSGAARYWELEIETWRESKLPLHLDWRFIDYSPFIPGAPR